MSKLREILIRKEQEDEQIENIMAISEQHELTYTEQVGTFTQFSRRITVGTVDDGQLHELPLLQFVFTISLQFKK